MRILHELNQLEMGGVERVVAGIVRHDSENHHTVYAYKDGPMASILRMAGAQVLIDDGKKTVNLDCDLIHIHTGGSPSIIASAVKNNFPTIETVHSPVVSSVRDEFVQLRVGVSRIVTKKNRKCITIYNGIDVDRLKQVPFIQEGIEQTKPLRSILGIPETAFVVGRLGRLGHDKNVDEFLVACKLAQDSNLIPELHVLIVGDEATYSRNYVAKTKVAAASLPIKNVHFHPSLEEVGWAYAAMNVFMYPSEGEGFCLVWLEAQAFGIPVLTWETDLSRELLYGSAFLEKKKTPRALSEALVWLYLNRSILKQYAVEGQRNAIGHFSEEKMCNEYQKLYLKTFREFYGKEPTMVDQEISVAGS